jgi:hypothetical protein
MADADFGKRHADFDKRAADVASLAEPQRRALRRFVVTQGGVVSKDEAAAAMGRGLLGCLIPPRPARGRRAAHRPVPTTHGPPGTRRRRLAKLYRRAEGQMSVSLPARHYDLAAGDATHTGTPVGRALTLVVTARGRELGERVREEGGNGRAAAPSSPPPAACSTSRATSPASTATRSCPPTAHSTPSSTNSENSLWHEPRPAARDGRRRGRRHAGRAAGPLRRRLLRPPPHQAARTEGPVMDWAGWAVFGPLGLFVEETDPATREHLVNNPRALTHAALVQAAVALVDTRLGPTLELRQSC